jgi:N6-adenosine-specific RNA methylase IME4
MNEVALTLGLSLVNLLSAGCMLWTKGSEKATKLQSLQLWAYKVFLLLTVDLVIISGLQLKLASEDIETAIEVVIALSWTVPPIYEV